MNDKHIKRILREEIRLFAMGQRVLREHKKLVAQRQDFESLVVLYLIEDLTGKPVDPALLSEGLWEKGKHLFSKLGSMEKSGKIFGRKKAEKDALARFFASVEKASNQLAKKTKTQIEKNYPGFPNVEKQEDFVNALMDIGEVYDTLEAQVKAGEMAAQMANPVVESLRELVVYYLDNELADVYKHLKEQDEEVRGKFTKRGAGEKDLAARSTTMQGLRSNVLPLVLAGTGAAAALLSQAPWFVETITTTAAGNPAQAAQEIQKILGPMDGEGFTQMLGRITQGDPAFFDPSTSPKELFAAMASQGINPQNPKALFKLGVDPTAYAQAIASGATDIGNMFPASNRGLWLDKGSQVVTRIVRNIQKLKTGVTGAAGAATTSTAMSAAGTILGALGLGAIASGAAVKMLRVKGLKASRAQLMSELVNEMPDFPIPEEEPKADPDVVEKDPEQAPDQKPGDDEPEATAAGKISYDIYTAGEKLGRGKGEALNSVLTSAEIERKYKDIVARHIRDQIEAKGININEAEAPSFKSVSPEQAAADAARADKESAELFGAEGEAAPDGEELVLDTAAMIGDLKDADAPAAMIEKILDAVEAWAKTQPNPTKINRPDAEPGEGGESEGEGDPGEGEGEPGGGVGEPTAPPLGGLSQGQMISLLNSTGLRWEEVGGKIDAWMKKQSKGPLGLRDKDLKRAETFRDELRKVWATFEGDDIKEAVQKLNISRSTWAMIPGFASYLKEQSRLNESKSFNRWKLLANIK